ncbi:MAG: peptidoglycan D,D-transpeptidase FtsI family protein [Wolinella sp.]
MEQYAKASKILVLFGFLLLGFFLFLSTVYYTILTDRKLPTLQTKKVESAIRGAIYSQDGFVLASSKKLYKAIVNTYNIDPDKKELFINLFSIYSGISKEELKARLQKEGNVVLSYNIDSKTAANLKQLAYKLNTYGVFREFEDKNGRVFKYGLSILESGEKRDYLYENSMEPLIGYVQKTEDKRITRVSGVKGVEKSYDDKLEPISDGIMRGDRDIGFNVILNKDAHFKERLDGYSVALSVPLKLQKKVERIVDEANKRLKAKEIVVGIMEAESGKILALASTNRFNPNSIKQKEYKFLNNSAIEQSFEPGSIIKPLVFSLLLEQKLINPNHTVELHNGRYKIKNFVITDTHKVAQSTIEDVLVFSSNIGMAKIAQSFTPSQYFNGLKLLGFSEPTGIDLPYEKTGTIPNVNMFRDELYKATVSYGYGMRATFMQMLKSYNVINNNGIMVNPYVVEHIIDNNGIRYKIKHEAGIPVLSSETTLKMRELLVKIVERGTGKGAALEGVVVGGKTGTAHIAKGGKYVNMYNSSFFGFAADGSARYTIGVVVFEPDASEEYFAARTAVPVYKSIVELLVQEKYLNKRSAE